MELTYHCKHFNELSTRELYTILKSRQEVFTIEQQCAYQDCDDLDLASYHLMGMMDHELMAYCRLLPTGIAYEGYCAIGRVLTRKPVRGQLAGKALMQRAIKLCDELFEADIKIGAQSYLEKFYREFGFVPTGHQYLEDNIPHMSMILKR